MYERNYGIIYTLAILLIAISVFNILATSGITGLVAMRMGLLEEETRPAEIRVTRLLYSGCDSCYDTGLAVGMISGLNAVVAEDVELPWDSAEAQSLISRYSIEVIPTVVITGETRKPGLEKAWQDFGEMHDDGTVIFTGQELPYYDVSGGSVVGLVSLVNLVDGSCAGCYDVSDHKQVIFSRFGVAIANEETHDIASDGGKALVKKYSITKVPTILLSPEADVYPDLKRVWPSVGTVENDGWYVFRELSAMGDVVYTELG